MNVATIFSIYAVYHIPVINNLSKLKDEGAKRTEDRIFTAEETTLPSKNFQVIADAIIKNGTNEEKDLLATIKSDYYKIIRLFEKIQPSIFNNATDSLKKKLKKQRKLTKYTTTNSRFLEQLQKT